MRTTATRLKVVGTSIFQESRSNFLVSRILINIIFNLESRMESILWQWVLCETNRIFRNIELFCTKLMLQKFLLSPKLKHSMLWKKLMKLSWRRTESWWLAEIWVHKYQWNSSLLFRKWLSKNVYLQENPLSLQQICLNPWLTTRHQLVLSLLMFIMP